MVTDVEIRQAMTAGLLEIDPLADGCLQPAGYDLRVGAEAFVSRSDEKIDVSNRGLVIIDPGEFAVLVTRERVRCGPQVAGQLGLESRYARQGLTLLSGPQVDPGFDGVLVVRVTNLAPRRVTLAYEAPFLTCQFFKLAAPVAHPYSGSRQGQRGLSARDIEELSSSDSPTLGGMVKSLFGSRRRRRGTDRCRQRASGRRKRDEGDRPGHVPCDGYRFHHPQPDHRRGGRCCCPVTRFNLPG